MNFEAVPVLNFANSNKEINDIQITHDATDSGMKSFEMKGATKMDHLE